MKVRIAVGGVVVALVVAAAVMFGPWRGADSPETAGTIPAPVTTLAPPSAEPTPQPSATTTVEPTPQPTGHTDEDAAPGVLVTTLTPDEDAAANAFAVMAATELTTQVVDEDRYSRLKPFFTAESSGAAMNGPAENNQDATVSPTELNWMNAFDPENPIELGVLISMQYDVSKPGNNSSIFGQGVVEWELTLVRDGAGWLASSVEMVSSTDS